MKIFCTKIYVYIWFKLYRISDDHVLELLTKNQLGIGKNWLSSAPKYTIFVRLIYGTNPIQWAVKNIGYNPLRQTNKQTPLPQNKAKQNKKASEQTQKKIK